MSDSPIREESEIVWGHCGIHDLSRERALTYWIVAARRVHISRDIIKIVYRKIREYFLKTNRGPYIRYKWLIHVISDNSLSEEIQKRACANCHDKDLEIPILTNVSLGDVYTEWLGNVGSFTTIYINKEAYRGNICKKCYTRAIKGENIRCSVGYIGVMDRFRKFKLTETYICSCSIDITIENDINFTACTNTDCNIRLRMEKTLLQRNPVKTLLKQSIYK